MSSPVHPRTRGRQEIEAALRSRRTGSPAHARKTGLEHLLLDRVQRFTLARAEDSRWTRRTFARRWSTPARGEESLKAPRSELSRRPYPRAGSTAQPIREATLAQLVHPRARGGQVEPKRFEGQQSGSPPRAGRTGHPASYRGADAGLTRARGEDGASRTGALPCSTVNPRTRGGRWRTFRADCACAVHPRARGGLKIAVGRSRNLRFTPARGEGGGRGLCIS
jgi:hypothetical protein